MKIERYPYRARAWWGDRLVAQSDSVPVRRSPRRSSPSSYFP